MSLSKEKFAEKYHEFVNKLPSKESGKYLRLVTESRQRPFKVFRNRSNSIVVEPFTNDASQMVVSLNQLTRVVYENHPSLYKSYEPILIDKIKELEQSDFSTLGEIVHETEGAMKKTLMNNIILYGPPGVGKTYNHKKIVAMIESGNYDQKRLFDAIVKNDKVADIDIDADFKRITEEGRVEFVTFHQSFSYEDFIEGFRPNEEGKIELDDGVFKRLAEKADTNRKEANLGSDSAGFDKVFQKLVENFDSEEGLRVPLKRPGSYFTIYDYNSRTIFFEKQNGSRKHSLSIKTLRKIYESGKNDLVVGGLSGYYNALIERLQEIGAGIAPSKAELKNYYLVIDEINRGNISKIFGELITLIEEDKRDTIEVTLPYSKEKFSVPSNLYIIATMNSTDKSIALIDIALRRRFTFLKMQPNAQLVKEEARERFVALNAFIAEKLGVDFQIGHSYFMDYDDLDFVLDYKIVPLLEEYFFADPDGLKEAKSLIGRSEA